MSSPKIVFSRASCPAFTITTNGETGIRQIGRNFCSYVLSVRLLCSSFSYRAPKSTHLSEQTALRRCACHIMLGQRSSINPQSMFTRIIVCLLFALISAPGLSGADFAMKVTDKNYLDTQGFSVFLYDSTYHPIFVDQKNTAMEMILHGQRIATNGDVRLMPTPEQWDLVATLKDRHADKANSRLTADLAFPTFDFSYTLEVAAEPGGVKVSINLDKPLPQKLVGRAGFNLEFLPSIYMGKAYLVDGTKAGLFPRTPNDPMIKVLPLADEPKKAYYLEDWGKAKGYTHAAAAVRRGEEHHLRGRRLAGPGQRYVGYGQSHAVRWTRPRAE